MLLTKKDTLVLLLCTASAGIGLGGLVAHHLEGQWTDPDANEEAFLEEPSPCHGWADDDDTDVVAADVAAEDGVILIEAENVAFASPEVFLNGVPVGFEDVGLGLVVHAAPGHHTLRLADGAMVQSWGVDLAADDPHAHVTFTKQQATLVIGTNPKGALMQVNGRDVMMATPVPANAPLKMRSGMHTIRFTMGEATYDYAVLVPAGESTLFIPELGRDATVGHAWVNRR